MSNSVIGFCGMTHLGLNSAVASAARGFDVVGFDGDASVIKEIDGGNLPVMEPDLDALFAKHRDKLTFSADVSALERCDVVVVAPDVPTDDAGKSDLSGIHALLDAVEPKLRNDAVLVILSQVNPGFTRARGRSAGPLYYQVETLIFGRAMERAMHPERFIIGAADPKAPLPDAYRQYLEAFGCPILPMGYESAELAKISINMCLVASVSVANTMAEICEHVGADWSEIAPALRLDKRIGEFSYIAPGLGISGGNLERDMASVITMAGANDTDGGVVRAWVANSHHRKGWPWRTLQKEVLAGKADARVCVLGLAYKENTHSTKNSPALELLKSMAPLKAVVYDPVVSANDGGDNTESAATIEDAIKDADAVVIMTPWPEFRELSPANMADAMNANVVIDPYGILNGDDARAAGLKHITLGVAPE